MLTVPGWYYFAATVQAQRADLDSAYRQQLAALAAKCDELGLAEQAKQTRDWFITRDPNRYYCFLPPTSDPLLPAEDAPSLVKKWHAKLTEYRQEQAKRLYTLAEQYAQDQREDLAYQLVHEVLHEDPHHAEARRVLDYRLTGGQWRRPQRRPRPRAGRSTHPTFGWARSRYWRVDSEHFRVTTNVSAQAGTEAADFLEEVYAVWGQLFFNYWSPPGRLADRLAGGNRGLGSDSKFEVVLFKDRDEYIRQLSRFEPQIGVSVGYYMQGRKTAFFYSGDQGALTTWVHEATHQFFQESGSAAPAVGEKANFWVVEGVAIYMESLRSGPGYRTAGGLDASRLQFARYRALTNSFYVPLKQLATYGRQTLQQDDDIRRLYSQASGLAHFLMHADERRYRQVLVKYLQAVYEGRDRDATLAELADRSFEQLDREYQDFLGLQDKDLAYFDARIQDFCATRTKVTDVGLRQLQGAAELRWLDLSFTSIGNAGLANFARSSMLSQLSVEGTRVSDEGMKIVKGFSQLQELDLSQTAITDEGLRHVAGLESLRVLWLTGTKVSDMGLKHLAGLKNLEQLEVQKTSVTAAGLQQLKQQLPNLKL